MIDNLTVYEFFEDADYYGICETAANTAAKVVTIPDFTLENGVSVMVKFKNNNTTNSPTLNVSDTGAKPIYIDPSVGISVSWEAWKVLPFVYDGTNWQLVCDPGIAVTQIPTDDSNNDYEVLFSKSPDNLEHMEEVRKSKYLKFNPSEKTLCVNDGYESQGTETVTNLFEDTSLISYSMTADVGWYNNYNAFWFRGIQSKTLLKYNPSISNNVIEIRYKIECINPPAEQTDYTKVCIGIKSTSQNIADVSSTDTDFIAKNIHQLEERNQVIEDVLRVNASSNYYLYVIANNQSMFLEKLETVQYEGLLINRSYLTDNELGVIKTANNVTTSLKVKDDDIVLSGTDNTWDGIHTSLKDIVKMGICLSQSLSGSTDISDTTPINLGGTMIQGNGRPILIQIYGVIKTDRNTSSLVMYIDGVEKVRAVTNSTTPMKVDGSAVVYLDAGIHTVSFKLVPQDNTTTATLCAYNTYGYTMIGA